MALIWYPGEIPAGNFYNKSARDLREFQAIEWMHLNLGRSLDSFVLSGMDLAAVAAQLSVDVAVGLAVIHQSVVEVQTSAFRITGLPASATDVKVYLEATKNAAGQITAVTGAGTTGALPANTVLLGLVNTGVSEITAGTIRNSAKKPFPVYKGTYTGNDAATRSLFLGFAPKLVFLTGQVHEAASTRRAAISGLMAGGIGFNYGDGDVSGASNSNLFRPNLTSLGFDISFANSAILGTYEGFNKSGQVYDFLAFP